MVIVRVAQRRFENESSLGIAKYKPARKAPYFSFHLALFGVIARANTSSHHRQFFCFV